MRKSVPLLLVLALGVTGCARVAESRLNPVNWFGPSTAVANTDESGNLRPLVTNSGPIVIDQRGAIDQISAVAVDRTPDGALVRATGIASTLGQFNAQLVPLSSSGGVLTLAFRVEAAANAPTGGSDLARQITVARAFSDTDLTGIRTIRVTGARNAREARR